MLPWKIEANLGNKKIPRLEGLPKAIPSAKASKKDKEKSSSYVILSWRVNNMSCWSNGRDGNAPEGRNKGTKKFQFKGFKPVFMALLYYYKIHEDLITERKNHRATKGRTSWKLWILKFWRFWIDTKTSYATLLNREIAWISTSIVI